MKKHLLLGVTLFILFTAYSETPAPLPGPIWEQSHTFDKYNVFKIEFYAKNGELMKTVSLENDEKYTADFKGVEMNTSINKINYFTF
jgi:hypothetical protein